MGQGALATEAVPIARRGVGRDSLTLAVGSATAQVLLVGVAPIITRLYTPAEIGASAVLVGAMGVWALASLQLDWAIPLTRSRLETAELCALSLATGVLLAAVVAVAVALFGDSLADAANVPEVAGWLWLLPFHVAIGAIALTAAGVLVRRRDFKRLAAATTAGLAAYAIVAVTGALHGEWRRVRETVRAGMGGLPSAAKRWHGFGLWGSASSGMNIAREALVPVLVAALYGPAAAGVVFVAQRVLQAPVTLANEAVARAWYGTAAEIVRRGEGELRAPLVRITRSVLLVGGGGLLVAVLAGPALFPVVFGQEFEAGSDVLLALAPLHFMMFVSTPAGMTLIALDRRKLQAVFTSVRLLGAVVAIPVAHELGWSVTVALALYAASMAAASACLGIAAWRLSGRADAQRLGSAA